MSDDVVVADSSPAEVAPVSDPTPAPSYTERISKLTGAAKDHWQNTGDVDAAEALMSPKKPDVKADSSPATPELETETDSAPVDTVEQPKGKDDASERSRRARERNQQRWDELLEERGRLKAEVELLRKQTAAGTAPPKPAEESKPDLEPPNLEDFETIADFNKANREFFKNLKQSILGEIEKKSQSERETQEQHQHKQTWDSRLKKAKETYPDFDAVLASDKLDKPSELMLAVIRDLDNGAEVAYALGKNPDEWNRLVELAEAPGIDSPFALGQRVGEVRAELRKVVIKPAKVAPEKPNKPLKEIISAQPKPSAEVDVEANAAPVSDPINQALKDKNFTLYKKLMNEKEIRELRGA